MAMKKVPDSEYPISKVGKEGVKAWIKDHGAIFRDPDRGNRLYLRWGNFGKDFVKGLTTTSMTAAMDRATSVRSLGEADYLKSKNATVKTEKSKSRSLYSELFSKEISGEDLKPDQDKGFNGFFQTFYPAGINEETGLELTNKNTRYDAEKVLNLFFGILAKEYNRRFWIKPKKSEKDAPKGESKPDTRPELTLDDLTEPMLNHTYTRMKRLGPSIKVQQKVTIALRKFINWEMFNQKKIPENIDLLKIISTTHTPKNSEIIDQRQKDLKDEYWTTEEFQKMYQACKNLQMPSKPLDAEILWVLRYMGLPPADVYQLEAKHFEKDVTWFVKDRAKRKRGGSGTYEQPMIKNKPFIDENGITTDIETRKTKPNPDYLIDLETIRIIKERIAATKKGERLFAQPIEKERARNDKQDDQTRWVSNFSRRRYELQTALGMDIKGVSGLRSTFITSYVNKGTPEIALSVWVGHVEGSTMIRKHYSDRRSRATATV